MSENKTPFAGLNQWEGNEYPKRVDFVNDNEKIDAALKILDETKAGAGELDVHIENTVDSEKGTHGIRYLNNQIEYQKAGSWEELQTGNGFYSNSSQVNLMPDGGVFAGNDYNPLGLFVTTPFQPSTFFTPYNGATTPISAGKFIYNNSTYGGTAGSLTPDVISLLEKINEILGTDRNFRHGAEFYIMEITAGEGVYSDVGLGAHLMTANEGQARSGASGWITASMWIRIKSGGNLIIGIPDRYSEPIKIYKNGYLHKDGKFIELKVVDGWTHVQLSLKAYAGYDLGFPHLFANKGDVVQIALPAFFSGGTGVGIHTAPIPTIKTI